MSLIFSWTWRSSGAIWPNNVRRDQLPILDIDLLAAILSFHNEEGQ